MFISPELLRLIGGMFCLSLVIVFVVVVTGMLFWEYDHTGREQRRRATDVKRVREQSRGDK